MSPGLHDALHALGPQAGHIVDLWRIFLLICTAVFIAVLVALFLAVRRAPRIHAPEPPDLSAVNVPEPRLGRPVTLAVAASVVLLFVLLAASVFTDRALARLPLKDAINIEVTAHQWWWTVKYVNGPVSETFETANEIHVPVGRPVVVKLNSDDVIHSLWIPNLAGKKDLVPGRTATLSFRADRPGVYRAQCAEFCGLQHAWMALPVTVEPVERYELWAAQQRQPATPPADAQARRGQQVFLGSTCVMCHNITGTEASARRAPDLTHLASRGTLAAGALPNDAQHLASWISNPAAHKPGATMPAHAFSQPDLQALVAYLGSLK